MPTLAISCLVDEPEDEESLRPVLLLELDSESAGALYRRLRLVQALDDIARLMDEVAPTGVSVDFKDSSARIVSGDAPWSHEPQYSAASLHDEADEGVLLDPKIPLADAETVETHRIFQTVSRNSVSWTGSLKIGHSGLEFSTRGIGIEQLAAIARGEAPSKYFTTAGPSDYEGDDEDEDDEEIDDIDIDEEDFDEDEFDDEDGLHG